MNAVMTGYYGMHNYGDDAFVHTCAWALPRYWNVDRVRVAAPPVTGMATDLFEVASGPLARWFPLDGVRGRFARGVVKTIALRGADIIVYGGGSTLSAVRMAEAKWFHEQLALRTSRELVGVGLSVGPFESTAARASVERHLRAFTHLAVRDESSFALLQDMDLSCEPILARDIFGLFPRIHPPEPRRPDQQWTLGVSLAEAGSFDAAQRDRVINGIAAFCRHRPDMAVRVFVLNGHPTTGDQAVSDRLTSALGDAVDVETIGMDQGVPAIWSMIAGCDAFFSVRLHGGISAYLAQVPFALVEYHRKCTDFLNDIGQTDRLRLPSRLTDHGQVVEVLEEMRSGHAARPVLATSTYSDQAELNFTGRHAG